jgi:hypothetical protein
LVELYQSSKSNVSEHIKHIFEEGELDENSVVRKFRTTASDSKNKVKFLLYINIVKTSIKHDRQNKSPSYHTMTVYQAYNVLEKYLVQTRWKCPNEGLEQIGKNT